jgi:hypothetical protein
MRDSGRLLLGVCLATLAQFPLLGQTTGDMKGSVLDAAGTPLSGVSIEARSPALQAFRAATTDANGKFWLPVLPPGVYAVSARLTGFRPEEQSGIRVPLGEAVTVPKFTLLLLMNTEAVVSGEAPLIDTANTRIGTSLTGQEISQLPLGRNYASVASTVAGTGQDAQGLTVYGATGLENQYIIDGLNTTGIRLGNQGKALNAEFVQEVEVRTGGYEAEYGQVFGGNINVITKSGGNEFHGGVFGYYDSGNLSSADQHVDDRNAVNAAQFTLPRRLDAGLNLGGYFLKDRVWFFGAFDRVASDEDYQRVESLTYPASGAPISNLKDGTDVMRTSLFSGKLTLRASPSHTFTLSVFGDPTELNGRGDTPPGPDSAILLKRVSGGTDVSVRWDGLFGPKFIAEAQYGYHEEKNRESSDFADTLSIWQVRRQVAQFAPGSGPFQLSDETYRRNVFKLTGTAFLGSHELKAGVNFENLNSSSSSRLGGDDFINQTLNDETGAFEHAVHLYFAKTPLNCVAKTNGSTGNFGFIDPTTCNGWEVAHGVSQPPTARNLALFVQDSWKIAGNLTLNAGLRYEEQRVLDANGNSAIKLTGEWSPRIGVVWDPLKNGQSKVFASAGRYYQVIPQDLQVRVLGNVAYAFADNYTDSRLDNINTLAPFSYVYSADYVPPGIKGMYQDEIVAGVEVEILNHWSVGLKGIYRALGRVIEDRCDLYDPRVQLQGLLPPDSFATCAVINVGEGQFGQIADPTNPDCFSDYPASTKPTPCESVKARRYFRGLQLDVKHTFADRFFLQASYLYSKLEGSYGGFVDEDYGQAMPGLNGDFDNIDVVPNSFGRLPLDRTHQAKLSGSYVLPFGLQVGLNSSFATGRPLSLYGYLSGDAYLYYTKFLAPRGSNGEMPSTYSIDLHLEYPLRLGAVTVVPILDVFNVTNVQTATNRNQEYNITATGDQSPPFTNPPNPSYGKDTAWQRPRLVRLGARVFF